MSEEPQGAIRFELEAKFTVDDIIDARMSAIEDQLDADRAGAEGQLKESTRRHHELEEKLKGQGDVLAKKVKVDKPAAALVKAINAFYASHPEKGERKSFEAVLDRQSKASIDVERAVVSVPLEVREAKGGYSCDSFEKPVELGFTGPMNNTVKVIEQCAVDVKRDTDALSAIRREIANLPRTRKRVKRAIIENELKTGMLQGGSRVLEVASSVEVKAITG